MSLHAFVQSLILGVALLTPSGPVRLLPGVEVSTAASQSLPPPSASFAPYAHAALAGWPADIWLRFTLASKGLDSEDWLLAVPYAERAELLIPDGRGAYAREVTGTRVPLADRSGKTGSPTLAIPHSVAATTPLYLHVRFYPDAPFSPTLRQRSDYFENSISTKLVQGLFLGTMLAVFLFNLYAFFGLRERPSIFFALYVASLGLNELVTTGIGAQYVWPTWAGDARLAILITNSLGFASFLIFARSFLLTRKTVPVLDTIIIINLIVQLALAVMQYALPVGRELVLPLLADELFGAVFMMTIGIVRWRQGFYPARFFVIAYVPSLIGVMANLWYDAFLPSGNWFFAANGVEFGAMLFAITISCSEVDRMRILDAERRRAQRIAATDALTGIPNRLAFNEALAAAIAQCPPDRSIGVLFIDLNGFKPINDRHGHLAGDHLLCAVAQRLQSVVRERDFVARLGGDEFAILVHDVPSSDVIARVSKHARGAIVSPVLLDGVKVRVGASIGVALYPQDGATPEELVEAADREMYAEKEATR